MTPSKIAYIVCIALLTYANLSFYPKWQKAQAEATLSYDVCGYYYYLPAIFIYKDLKKVAFHEAIDAKYQPQGGGFYAALPSTNGNLVMKYSCGMAIMYAPAFFVAHALAAPLGFPADGFSLPYQFAISFWSLLWAFVGLFYVRKLLLKCRFTEGVTATVLLLYVFATNYLEYASITSAMSHNYLFTLYALMLWQTIKFYENPKTSTAASIGVCIGLAALARPTELLVCIVPILWGVSDKKTLMGRVVFLIKHFPKLIVTSVVVVGLLSIQFGYLKYASGHALYNSYGNEKWFDWTRPHILDGLFSARRGWLVYTPIMLFSLIGFYPLYKKRRDLFWGNFLFALLFIYVSFAFKIWWYGGSLGQRQMIQAMPMLALPLASFLEIVFVFDKTIRRILFGIATIVCIYLNFWWVYQAHQAGGLWRDEVTQAYFRRIVGRWNVPLEAQKLLDNKYDLPYLLPDATDVTTVFEHNFESDTLKNTEIIDNNRWLFLDANNQISPNFVIPPLSIKGKKWLRATATFLAPTREGTDWSMTQFIIEFRKGNETLRSNMVRPHRLMGDGEKRRIWLDAKVPKGDFDNVNVRFWNAGGNKKMLIDDLEVQTFN